MKNSLHETSRLSCGQQALWYLNQLEPNSSAYHLGICLELHGALDEQALASAWMDIGMAHPQLRARFTLGEEGPRAAINSFHTPLRVETNEMGSLLQVWRDLAGRPFALNNEAPVRALLLRGANGASYLLLCAHHLVADLWSSAIILRELSEGYKAHTSGRGDRAGPREKMEYAEFTTVERRWLAGSGGQAAWEFWRRHFTGMKMEPVLTQSVGDEPSGEIAVVLDDGLARLVRQVAREKATTPYAVLLACYARLLGEQTGRDELIIGTPATIRDRTALRNTVGYLVNAVPVRCPIGTRGQNVVGNVAANAVGALRHRRFPFPLLAARLGIPRTPGITPVFQTMFAYQSLPRTDRGLLALALNAGGAPWKFGGGITAGTVAMPAFDAQFPIALLLGPDGEKFSGRLQYDGHHVTKTTTVHLAGRFPELIQEFLTVRKSRRTEAFRRHQGDRLEHLFDETAGRMPDAIAVTEGGINLSYAELRGKAEALSVRLEAALSGCEKPVAVQMTSCAEAAIVILAILKSGRAFLPIDPDEPGARRNAALLLTSVCALVSPSGIDPGILPEGVIALNPEKLGTRSPSTIKLPMPSRTAYLIYTSGSTGDPKAVEVEHAAVINHAKAAARLFKLTPHDRVLQFHTLAFDAAFEEIFPSWIAGACVVFEPQVRNLNIPAFMDALRRNAITVLNLPTSYWHMLTTETMQLKLPAVACVRLLIVGGEQASTRIFSLWRKLAPGCRWINTYGPTEATITALAYEPAPNASIRGIIPIGRPIDGVMALVLNEAGEPISAGKGELLIGGKGLALGYCGDSKATAAKFVTRMVKGTAQRFYRTADLVRLRRNGDFEYLGRLDRQLKIRGCRVDPEETERVLRAHPAVMDAVVMPEKVNGDLILKGWVTRVNGALNELELRAHLRRHLPAQMVPSQLTVVTRLPRKPNGKIDRAALAEKRTLGTVHDGSGPLKMAALFSELIGHKVGPQDDFFLSGGHSLLAIRLLGRIEARFGARVSASDFAAAPTASEVWKLLQTTKASDKVIVPEPVMAETPVSAQQKRALLAHEIGMPSLANIVLLLRINGRFDAAAFSRAVETVARQNFLMRAGFFRTEDGIVLRETKLPQIERRILAGRYCKKAIIQLAQTESCKPFALDKHAPWIRLLLVAEPENKNPHLVVITHHAVADGWAFEFLLDELRASYAHACDGNGESLKPGQDYRVYARQQKRWLESPAARTQLLFWKRRLAGVQELRLPFRHRTSPVAFGQIERRATVLPAKLSHDFRQVAAAYQVTPFALAMACFKALVFHYAGQGDITLGTVVSNRTNLADQKIFGPLQNPVLIRDEVTAKLSLRSLAQRVAHSLAEAQNNGALPFAEVVRAALPKSSTAREGGVQFLSNDRSVQKIRLGGATLCSVEMPSPASPFELSMAVAASAPGIKIVFEYQTTAYAARGIQRLEKQFSTLLQSVVEAPDATVGELNLIPAGELRAFHRRVSKRRLPRIELLHKGFEFQARTNPGATAVVTRERRLTYGEIDSMSNTTAQVLMERGLKKQGFVAVMLPKGWEQVVGCLAILKAGGVYVPLDPALPVSRLKTIFEQGGFQAAIVADASLGDRSWARGVNAVVTVHSPARCAPKSRRARLKPDALAYVIYTSGSTGIPKGVMISHQAAMTTIAEINRRFQVRPGDRVFAVSALGFDLSVFDIFGTLRAGGTIVIPESRDPKAWLEQMVAEQVTVWNSVPCLFELLLDEATARGSVPETLRLIMLSGDFISLALAHRTRAELPRARFVSLGGATEGAIWSIAREVNDMDPAWHRIPYGRPLRGQEIFVLDSALNHCAVGATGELFIAGAGLANGYWHNPSETKLRFLHHPQWNLRLYRTGDQGRYLENGEIEILGRLDEQVKLNGIRLELGEVEAALRSLHSVRHALVEVQTDAVDNKTLVAFVAAEPGTTSLALLAHARKTLPAALVPSRFVRLERFPLNANGKVDRSAIRAMDLPAHTETPPENSAEMWIANLWSSLLGGINFGVEDDFFALGGHSLLAIKMLQRVRSHFGVDLPLSLVVENPTVRSLAAAVNVSSVAAGTGLPQRATAELERDTEPVIAKRIHRSDPKPEAVLLTGATGHLGSALLIELLEKTSGLIYCLVRAGSGPEAEKRIRKVLQLHSSETALPSRIVAVPADLGRERLGLEPAVFADLALSVRAIYHCAAEVNFIASYEKLATSNIGGVREMIRLATAADAVLHHVSSVAVFPYGGGRILREDEDISRIKTLTGGYAQTKWAAERMVWKAVSQGLRAVIYRPAQIVGRSADSPHDLFEHALRACQTMRSIPDIEAKMDMVTSKYAAAAIRALSIQESSLGKAFHLVHPEPISLRDFAGFFPEVWPVVPLHSWLASLNQTTRHRDDPSVHFVSMLVQGLQRGDLTPPGFDCSETTTALRGSGVVCPPLNLQFIRSELALPEENP